MRYLWAVALLFLFLLAGCAGPKHLVKSSTDLVDDTALPSRLPPAPEPESQPAPPVEVTEPPSGSAAPVSDDEIVQVLGNRVVVLTKERALLKKQLDEAKREVIKAQVGCGPLGIVGSQPPQINCPACPSCPPCIVNVNSTPVVASAAKTDKDEKPWWIEALKTLGAAAGGALALKLGGTVTAFLQKQDTTKKDADKKSVDDEDTTGEG